MTTVRRATGPMLAAWLLATMGAVGVAWVGVHPVADLGMAERPPVPQPEVANSPSYGGNHASDPDGPGLGAARTRSPSDGATSASPGPSRSLLPTKRPPSPKPTISPSAPTPEPSNPTSQPPETVYRQASTDGGTVLFEYDEGSDVYVADAQPYDGWDVSAYRYYRDWVVVEFTSYDHKSTAHGYLDNGQARIDVVEEDT